MAVARIRPDKVQLNTLDRPGCVDWIRATTTEKVEPFVAALRPICAIEIVGKFKPKGAAATVSPPVDIENNLMRILARRPCTLADLTHITNLDESRLEQLLERLIGKGKVKKDVQERSVFFRKVEG